MKDKTMKVNKLVNLLAVGLILTVAASGCRKKPVNVTELPGARAGTVPDMPPGGAINPTPGMTTEPIPSALEAHSLNPPGVHDNWIKDPDALKAETVYFAYDSSVIKSTEQPKVAAVADYLKANPDKAVLVEGNCDERGTEEYNRALGERRALAVREDLINLGIDPTHVDTISYGKDRPVDPGHDESAWRKNRRDDFVVLSPPK